MVGFGVDNGLQLTIEGQRAVVAAERVFSIGLPEALRELLRSSRIPVTELDDRFEQGDDYAAAFVDVADFVLKQAALDPPVALLVPGNPMFQNTLSRFLVQTARQRGVPVQVLPGISIIDALISDIGLDVTAGGLQVFDARQLLRKKWTINPRVPVAVLGLGGLMLEAGVKTGLEESAGGKPPADPVPPADDALSALATQLRRIYPDEHPVTLVRRTTGRGEISHSTTRLKQLAQLAQHVTLTSVLFIDVVRRS